MGHRVTNRVWLGIALSCLVGGGCGPEHPEIAPVQGIVRIDGEPVRSGSVEFWPSAGRPARGPIQEDGSYALTTYTPKDGAKIGSHVVTIRASEVGESDAPEITSLEQEMKYFSDSSAPKIRRREVKWLVPEPYSRRESSGLTAEVKERDNTIDWDLKSR